MSEIFNLFQQLCLALNLKFTIFYHNYVNNKRFDSRISFTIRILFALLISNFAGNNRKGY